MLQLGHREIHRATHGVRAAQLVRDLRVEPMLDELLFITADVVRGRAAQGSPTTACGFRGSPPQKNTRQRSARPQASSPTIRSRNCSGSNGHPQSRGTGCAAEVMPDHRRVDTGGRGADIARRVLS